MVYGIKSFVSSVVGIAWTSISDFMPKRTVDELAFIIEDLRSQLFDGSYEDLKTGIELRQQTSRDAYRVLAKSSTSAKKVKLLQELNSLFDSLLIPPIQVRDVFAGSYSDEMEEVGEEWQQVSEHTSTGKFLALKGKGTLCRIFESRERRDETIQLRTQLRVKKQMLLEIRELLKPEAREIVDIKMNALEFAIQSINSSKTKRAKKGSDHTETERMEIPIE